jgi:hypothetical protein
MNNSINRSAMFFGSDWPKSGAIPESLSAANWTLNNEGFVQQTFLGCTISNFNVNGEFGDTSSTLNVSLVPDEFNTSDGSPIGFGDDVYHNGISDSFAPPPVGSPVFFKFGKNHCTIEQAWRATFDRHYNFNTLSGVVPEPSISSGVGLDRLEPNNFVDVEKSIISDNFYTVVDKSNEADPLYLARGKNHFVFGGILQKYSQDSNPGGDPTYEVSVVDPREILSNSIMILNNYSDSTFRLPNLFNVFGFLEYNPTSKLRETLESYFEVKSLYKKIINIDGTISYMGGFDPLNRVSRPLLTDAYAKQDYLNYLYNNMPNPTLWFRLAANLPNIFPYTGTSYSKRNDNGIPFYRVVQAMSSMMGFYGRLPEEYEAKGFGSTINFRGFNYIVDFSAIPVEKIPATYLLNFDQMTIMEFCQEVCDVINHDLFVSLLPVVDHPGCAAIFQQNKQYINDDDKKRFIAGIIRIDCIDRSKKPEYGAIKKYIIDLQNSGVNIVSTNEGYELSNVTTDKFIVGAQQVDTHFFSTNNDRDFLESRKLNNGIDNRYEQMLGDQWLLSTSLKQQLIPFYGFLGKDAVSIPRGFGAYQQILLDATDLNANGVGNYYVATEIELRAASRSFQEWKNFLLNYNNIYLEPFDGEMVEEQEVDFTGYQYFLRPMVPSGVSPEGVTVPRCVFNSDRNYMGPDGLPASPCSPPFGYPLYYKRASMLGFPEGGINNFRATREQIISNLNSFRSKDSIEFNKLFFSKWEEALSETFGATNEEQLLLDNIKQAIKNANNKTDQDDVIRLIEEFVNGDNRLFSVQKNTEKAIENITKVYNFVKAAADNLGKKFLVKIPKQTNPFYNKNVLVKYYEGQPTEIENMAVSNRIYDLKWGPFGFIPRKISDNYNYNLEVDFNKQIYDARYLIENMDNGYIKPLLSYGLGDGSYTGIDSLDMTYGALKSNYNQITYDVDFNYAPEPQGGFFHFDLYKNLYNEKDLNNIRERRDYPPGYRDLLFPLDVTNFLSQDGRISPYVRFDNSQFLNMGTISKDSMYQQIATQDGLLIPDIANELENTRPDKRHAFPNNELRKSLMELPKTTAFVKCSLDDKFYLAPKLQEIDSYVFGRKVKNISLLTPPKKVFNQTKGEVEVVYTPYTPMWVPDISGGIDIEYGKTRQEDFKRTYSHAFSGDIIDTTKEFQDQNHVYALITLPEKITSTIDSLHVDGPMQEDDPVKFKHLLGVDIVRNVIGFEKPPIFEPTTKDRYDTKSYYDNGFYVTDNLERNTFKASQNISNNMSLVPNRQLSTTAPSPIYPDLIAIPLMSKERCYGPWISSQNSDESIKYSEIPGKIEFIKNEGLSPWSYAGYDLMNEAGLLECSFSNSLLLFSENGSITYNGLPDGNSLCTPLVEGGPLVTSISISVDSQNGVSTTYNMSLFTPKFGKMQKQKEQLLAKLSRERQKTQDERNILTRKGFSKSQNSFNYELYNQSLKNIDVVANLTAAVQNKVVHSEHTSSKQVSAVESSNVKIMDPETKEISTFVKKSPVTFTQNVETSRSVRSNVLLEEHAVKMIYNSTEEENSEPVSLGIHNNMPNFIIPSRQHYS